MRHAILFVAFLMCCGSALPADTDSQIFSVHIIVVQPDGFGRRYPIPFRGTVGTGGLRRWEAIAKPYYADSEDTATLPNVNLFSLCNITISAERPEKRPAHLAIDFTRFNVPAWIKISKDEVVSAIFYCIIKTSFHMEDSKPSVSVICSPEYQAIVDRAKAEYDKDDFGHMGERTTGGEAAK